MINKLKKYHNNIDTLSDNSFTNVIYFDFSFSGRYIEFYRIFDDIGKCSGEMRLYIKWIIPFYSSFVWHHK